MFCCYKLFDGERSLITLARKTPLAGHNTEKTYLHYFSCCFMPYNYTAGFYLTVHSYWRELLPCSSLELGEVFQALLFFPVFFVFCFPPPPESTHPSQAGATSGRRTQTRWKAAGPPFTTAPPDTSRLPLPPEKLQGLTGRYQPCHLLARPGSNRSGPGHL